MEILRSPLDGQHGGAGGHHEGPVFCTGIGGGGDGQHPNGSGEGPGGLVVGVLGSLRQGCAVQRHRQVPEDGVEHVRQHQSVLGLRRGVAGVLHHKGVGDAAVFLDRGRTQGLADGQRRPDGRRHRGRGGQGRRQPSAGEGDGVDDLAFHVRGRISRDLGLIEHHGVAPGGDRQAGNDQRGTGFYRGGRLQNAVDIIPHRPGHIGQGIPGHAVQGVGPQVVRQHKAGDGRGAAVHQGQHIGNAPVGCIGGGGGFFRQGQHFLNLTGDGVGIRCAAGVGQGGEIGKLSHTDPPLQEKIAEEGLRNFIVCAFRRNVTGYERGC